jgi:hypothetical protein
MSETDCKEHCFILIAVAGGGVLALLGLGIFIMVTCRRRRNALERKQQDSASTEPQHTSNHDEHQAAAEVRSEA